jgi:hypothetical protein
MLAVDSPLAGSVGDLVQAGRHFLASLWPPRRPLIEAAPLLLAGLAFLASLAVSRPRGVELTKQLLLGSAFILWGIDLLLPPGSCATLLGAVVIALYVFDLAWMTEANLKKRRSRQGPQSRARFGEDGCARDCCETGRRKRFSIRENP